MKLQDKVALVTGGAQGMGRAISLRFVQEGARVVVADINLEGAQRTAAEITEKGGQAVGVQVQVGEPGSIERSVGKAKRVLDRRAQRT